MWNPPRGTGCACVLLVSALGLIGSHRWRRHSVSRACSSVDSTSTARALPWHATVPSCRGPCSRRRERRFFRVGPDMEITQPEGQLPKVAWCGGTNRSYSKSDGPNLNLTQFQPRTPREVLRGERPKRVLVSFARSKETPSGKRPRQAGKPNPQVVRRSTPQLALRLPAPLTQGSLWKCAASSQRSVSGGGAGLRLRNWRRSISPKKNASLLHHDGCNRLVSCMVWGISPPACPAP